MQKEYITTISTVLTVNLVQSKPESLRKVVEKTTTVRVYENGYIGVAGSVGEPNFEELEKQAIANLEFKLPYPCSLPENKVRHIDATKNILDEDNFLDFTREMMSRISAAQPDFIFSNKIFYRVVEQSYKNTLGTDLYFKGNSLEPSFVIKGKNSPNLFDFFYGVKRNYVDIDKMIEEINTICEGYNTHYDIEPGRYPVLLPEGTVLAAAITGLIVEPYAAGSTIFRNKLNEKIFADNYSVYFDRNPETVYDLPFFDAEGEFNDQYRTYLIKDGVLVNLLGNKRSASLYNLPICQNSASQYDDIPTMSFAGFDSETVKKDFAELTKEKTIFVIVASGGDITTSGDFATPVQYAYMVQNGKILGRLPDIKINGNIFDIYGKDFVCCVNETLTSYSNQTYSLTYMNVEK